MRDANRIPEVLGIKEQTAKRWKNDKRKSH